MSALVVSVGDHEEMEPRSFRVVLQCAEEVVFGDGFEGVGE